MARLGSAFNKRRMKACDRETIRTQFSRVQQALMKYNITDPNMYNMDEKRFRQAISDKEKVICVRQERGISGKMAAGDTREFFFFVNQYSY